MSDYKYTPRQGDEVEIVLRGVVRDVFERLFFLDGAFGVEPDAPYVVRITKTGPPMPSAPGSVVRGKPGSGAAGVYYLRLHDEGWLSEGGELCHAIGPAGMFDTLYDAAGDQS